MQEQQQQQPSSRTQSWQSPATEVKQELAQDRLDDPAAKPRELALDSDPQFLNASLLSALLGPRSCLVAFLPFPSTEPQPKVLSTAELRGALPKFLPEGPPAALASRLPKSALCFSPKTLILKHLPFCSVQKEYLFSWSKSEVVLHQRVPSVRPSEVHE